MEAARSISLLGLIGRVGLMLVCCRFFDARTVLLLIMIEFCVKSTVSYAKNN